MRGAGGEVIARHDSWCPWCGEAISAWEHEIEHLERRGWVHAGCAERIRNHEQIKAHEEEDDG